MAKQKQKLTTGGASAPLADIPAVTVEEPKTVRVRMLKPASTAFGYLRPGQTVNLPVAMAASWLKGGLAEEDKQIDSAPETKQED
ncbi:MAG TPA: hypothetical protein VNA25_26385 [Phycisphaerae bacterium]|nr:hypothetical protein [Phycisphaerae bacterium]